MRGKGRAPHSWLRVQWTGRQNPRFSPPGTRQKVGSRRSEKCYSWGELFLKAIRNANLPPEMEWLDCETFERRHILGKGSLVLLNYIPTDRAPYTERQQALYDSLSHIPAWHSWGVEQFMPPENSLLSFAYTYSQDDNDAYSPTLPLGNACKSSTNSGTPRSSRVSSPSASTPHPRANSALRTKKAPTGSNAGGIFELTTEQQRAQITYGWKTWKILVDRRS